MNQPAKVIVRLYALASILCPLVATSGGDPFLSRLLLYFALPLSVASMAMAFASRWLPGTRVDFALAVCWTCATPTLCVPLPADHHAALLVLASTRAALVAMTSLLLLMKVIVAIRRGEARLTQLLHGGGLALLVLLFARSSLIDLIAICAEEYPPWLGTLAEELRLFSAVTMISAVAVASAAARGRASDTRLRATGSTS